ncbi:hypothetical protein SK128_011759, partial [Halocaridina rubra]
EAMALLMIEQGVFAYDNFVKNNESVTAVQREFRRRFHSHRNQAVPTRNTILRWVHAFRIRGTLMNSRPVGPHERYVLQKMESFRPALLRSPNHSARRHATELDIDNRSVRLILHEDLHFRPLQIGHWATVEIRGLCTA